MDAVINRRLARGFSSERLSHRPPEEISALTVPPGVPFQERPGASCWNRRNRKRMVGDWR